MPNLRSLMRPRVLIALGVLAFAPALEAQGWYSTSWLYRKTVTINRTRVQASTPLPDFPVLISLTADADLAARAQSSGNDLVFTASDGVTKLSHEIERYVASSGQLV